MLEDFLDGELEAELQDLTAKSEELILSEQQALKQLEQSPSVTGPFKQEAASASPSPSPAPAPIEDEEENLMAVGKLVRRRHPWLESLPMSQSAGCA